MPDERGNASELEPRFYPNLIARLYLMSLEDVMGRNGVNALLNLAGLFALLLFQMRGNFESFILGSIQRTSYGSYP